MNWSQKEDNRLEKMYANKGNKEVANALGRTVGSVRARASRKNLKKSAKYVAKMRASRKTSK